MVDGNIMNERIKELVKQAGGHISMRNLASNPVQHIESVELWDDKIEKFAELIVKECADIIQRESDKAIRNNTYMGDDVPASVTQWAIKKHFGVE
jgi:hypothetical protein